MALRRAADTIPSDRRRAREVLTTLVPLSCRTETLEVRLHRINTDRAQGSTAATLSIPCNSALTILNASGSIEFALCAQLPELCTYEFAIGPLSRDCDAALRTSEYHPNGSQILLGEGPRDTAPAKKPGVGPPLADVMRFGLQRLGGVGDELAVLDLTGTWRCAAG